MSVADGRFAHPKMKTQPLADKSAHLRFAPVGAKRAPLALSTCFFILMLF